MFVGIHGRKGLKSDQTVCGSNVQYLSINSYCPVMILKKKKERKDKPEGAYRFLACVDGSEKSLKSLSLCC
jgi:hypothetical protein